MADRVPEIDWIAVDWGTSHLRAWAMQGDTIVAKAQSEKGMGGLAQDAFEPALLELIGPWLGTDPVEVMACGMVGSRQGWIEAPYRAVPCTPQGPDRATPDSRDARLNVAIMPGIKQMQPADVMRGEETQIAGYLDANPDFDGVLCLPGTHSKWVHISAGEIVSFRTALTGELFGLLADQSVLRHSVGSGWDEAAFLDALGETLAKPASLAQRLFTIRASDLLHGTHPGTARAVLSGLLIGAELAAAKPYWLGQSVAVIGSTAASGPYVSALRAQGLPVDQADGDAMVLRGLHAARTIKEPAQ